MVRLLPLASAFVLVVLCAGLVAGCGQRHRPAPPTNSTIEVVIDPRIELIGIMRALSREPQSLAQLNFDYARKVWAHFAPFQQHPALRRFVAADRALHGGDLPVWALLHHTPTPDLAPRAAFPALLLEFAGGRSGIEDLLGAMREFSEATGFPQFHAACADVHRKSIAAVERSVRSGPILGWLESYHGARLPRYRVVLAPLLHDANYGPRVVMPDGMVDPYVIVVRRRVQAGAATFGAFGNLRPLLWHEFGHSLINPLVDASTERLLPLAPALVPDSGRIKAGNYGQRTATYVSEYLIRAIGIRLTATAIGHAAARRELERQVKLGFLHLPGLCRELERYEADRTRYPSFADFFPEVLAYLERVATAGKPAKS